MWVGTTVRVDPQSRLMRGVEDRAFVYYTHSYRAPTVIFRNSLPVSLPITAGPLHQFRGGGGARQCHGSAVSSGEVRRTGMQVLRNLWSRMLTKRIIACLDVRSGRVVKGVQFVDLVDAGDPAELARRHAAAGADEIVLLDITATHEGRGTLLDTVRRTAKQLFIPFTVGGGIRSAEEAAAVFDAGADKVSVNSAAIADPNLIDAIGQSFGAQAVIVAIDARRATGRPGWPGGGVCERWTYAYRPTGDRVGAGSRSTWSGRDSVDFDGCRWHSRRV